MRLSSVALALLLALPARAGEPFATLDFDAADAAARQEGKLLIVDFTATWCGPCQKMVKETWPDETLDQWLAAHAVTIRVDVDEQHELAQRFDVREIPTVIILRDGQELDRKTGFQPPAGLVQWAEPLAADRRGLEERAADDAKQLAVSDKPYDIYHLGQDLMRLQHFDEAAAAFVRAFELGREPDFLRYTGWRYGEMARDMVELAQRHARARESFDKLIEASQARVYASDPPVFDDWCEWTALCAAFERNDDVLHWYEAKRDAQGRLFGGGDLREVYDDELATLLRAPRHHDKFRGLDSMRNQVVVLLGKAGRAPEALALLEDPVARARERLDDRGMPDEMRFFNSSELYALAVQAARADLAEPIARLVIERDKTGHGRQALVEAVIFHGVQDEAHCRQWLDEAEKLGVNVVGLRELLDDPPPPSSFKLGGG